MTTAKASYLYVCFAFIIEVKPNWRETISSANFRKENAINFVFSLYWFAQPFKQNLYNLMFAKKINNINPNNVYRIPLVESNAIKTPYKKITENTQN